MKLSGRVYQLPEELRDHVNTDVILASSFLRLPEAELGAYAFHNVLPDFSTQLQGATVLVADRNFGCGSSREQAPKALISAGVQLVIAASFGFIFHRNAVNLGLATLVMPDDQQRQSLQGQIEVDLAQGKVQSGEGALQGNALADSTLQILHAGGLLPLLALDNAALD